MPRGVPKPISKRFEAIRDRLAGELERRTSNVEKLGGLEVGEIESMLRACRDNLLAISQMEIGQSSQELRVITKMPFEEGE